MVGLALQYSSTELGCISDVARRRMKARFIPSLSERAKASQRSQPTSVEGDQGGGSELPTRRWEMTEGAPDTLLQKRLCEIYVSQLDTILRELCFSSDDYYTKA